MSFMPYKELQGQEKMMSRYMALLLFQVASLHTPVVLRIKPRALCSNDLYSQPHCTHLKKSFTAKSTTGTYSVDATSFCQNMTNL